VSAAGAARPGAEHPEGTVSTAVTERSLAPVGRDQYSLLTEWVRQHARPDAVLLDVGAGDGDQPYPTDLRPAVARIVGVDEDEGILRNQRVDDRVHAPLERFAATTADRFDLAVAVYVVEHVTEPAAFAGALHSLLRPGASAFLLTPNRWHYFGAAALAAERLHIDEWLLHRLRDADTLHEHHFRIQYRMNSARAIRRVAAEAGFRSVELRMIDEPGIYQPYFPPALRALPEWYSQVIHRFGWSGAAGTILARLER
jgi:SAM-dependent methyltransferase